ncbi:hypothetical protein [Microbacterium paludicola]|uniref:hypothetical protein n=1 Tax=Microbacterium paludicola TaxID=300019 RepID=UPI0021B5C6C3|nr:hypothetical protein [Microbacterium paludicola]
MEQFIQGFWEFAGHYWWLVFPIMGMAGGAAKAWERSSKRRHERRLETIRVKGEIKAAQLAARGRVTASTPKDAPSDASLPSNELLARLFAEHDEITARWLDYELDVAKLIAYPAMSDGRQPLTAAFLRAKKTADTLRPSSRNAKVSEQQVSEYLDAVGNMAVAFEIAEKEARRLRTSTFSEAERKKLDRAQQLLRVAVDESATQAERNVAYKRVREELDGLIVLSDQAVHNLEKQVAGEITASARPEPAPEPRPESQRMPEPMPRRTDRPVTDA